MIHLLPFSFPKKTTLFLPLFQKPEKVKAVLRPPRIIMWNHPKTHQMVAYGCIAWSHSKTSPFYEKNIPAITKLFSLRGYINNPDLSKLIDRLEDVMARSGYIRFGASVKTSEKEELSFLLDQGYIINSLNLCEEVVYLEKKRELLT